MAILIKAVTSRKDLKIFARFANNLYKGSRFYVPSMPWDDLNTFDKDKNGAFEFCEVILSCIQRLRGSGPCGGDCQFKGK